MRQITSPRNSRVPPFQLVSSLSHPQKLGRTLSKNEESPLKSSLEWSQDSPARIPFNIDPPSPQLVFSLFDQNSPQSNSLAEEAKQGFQTGHLDLGLPHKLEMATDYLVKYPKNIIKNFMVGFFNFVDRDHSTPEILALLSQKLGSKTPSLVLAEIQASMGKFRKASSARQLQRCLRLGGVRELFVYFLEVKAEEWILRSNKLQLKGFHRKAIEHLLVAAQSGQRVRFPIFEWKQELSPQ